MSCQKNATQVAVKAAKQSGITSQASKVGQALALKENEKLQAQSALDGRSERVKKLFDGLERQVSEGKLSTQKLVDEMESQLKGLERLERLLFDEVERGDQKEGGAKKEKSPAQPDWPPRTGRVKEIFGKLERQVREDRTSAVKEVLDEVEGLLNDLEKLFDRLEGGDQKKGAAKKKKTPTALSGKAGRVKADRKAQAARVKQFHQAIQQKHKVSVRYRSPKGMRKYTLVPLDVKAGQSDQARKNKYMWGYSENARTPISLRLDRVLAVKQLDEASFDPADLAKVWAGKKVDWTLPREW